MSLSSCTRLHCDGPVLPVNASVVGIQVTRPAGVYPHFFLCTKGTQQMIGEEHISVDDLYRQRGREGR